MATIKVKCPYCGGEKVVRYGRNSKTGRDQIVYDCVVNMGRYELDFDSRTYLEEHIFQKQWFASEHPEKILPEYKFWLPIRKLDLSKQPAISDSCIK